MKHIEICIQRYPALAVCRKEIEEAVALICKMYHQSGKLLLCGNGGSAADCEHISGELLKGFLLHRPPLAEEIEGLRPEIAAQRDAYKALRFPENMNLGIVKYLCNGVGNLCLVLSAQIAHHNGYRSVFTKRF